MDSSTTSNSMVNNQSHIEIEVTTLGNLTILQNQQLVENFISTKASLLFVYLAMHPGDHTRKKLAAMFWSETSDKQALKNLRTILSSVRQKLPDALIVSRDSLAINPDMSIQIDANQFEQGCKTAFASPQVLDLSTYMQALVELYQGQFLADVTFRDAINLEDWIIEKQRHLHQLYSQLLYEIVELAYKQADYETGLAYSRRLVTVEPLWDVAHRQLMRLLANADRTNDALVVYEEFVNRLDSELQTEPEIETTDLYKQIQSHRFNPKLSTGIMPVILPDMPFVEPATDIEIAQRMLNTPNCRLLTVFGISGIGKTTLALQLAYHRQHLYRDGTCFVSLTTAQSKEELLHAIATAVNINVSHSMDAGTLSHTIIDFLKTRELLLVLDNYEQLLPDTEFVQRMLQEVRSVQMIITSQVPLNMYREWLVPLRGLSLPEIDTPQSDTYEAIRLFELTAQRINPHFRLDDSLDEVIRICQLVDSLPLGIILAAGWVQYISPSEILSMMQDDILQLESVHHDIPARHQSFRGMLDAMLAHLSPKDQQALMCLSIFEGSFDYRAALAIADITMEDFKHLTDKCLVQRTEGYRFTVHGIVRHAFKSQLQASEMLQIITERYITHFQEWCDDLYMKILPLHELMVTIDVEQHNLWDVSGLTDSQRLQFLMHIAPAMSEYWVNRGYHARGVLDLLESGTRNTQFPAHTRIRGLITLARILERTSQYDRAWNICHEILEMDASVAVPHIRMRALRVLSEICAVQADFNNATQYLQAIIAMEPQTSVATHPKIEQLISLAYEDLGDLMLSQGQYDKARHHIQIAIQRWHDRGEVLREAIARSYLGIIAIKEKKYNDAYQLFTDILADAYQAKNQTLIVIFSYHLGICAMHLGDYQQCCDLFQSALQLALQIDRKTSIINLMEQFSHLAILLEHYAIGAQLEGFASCMRHQLHIPIMPHHQPDQKQRQHILRESLESEFDGNYEHGCQMGLLTAVQRTSTLVDTIVQSP